MIQHLFFESKFNYLIKIIEITLHKLEDHIIGNIFNNNLITSDSDLSVDFLKNCVMELAKAIIGKESYHQLFNDAANFEIPSKIKI